MPITAVKPTADAPRLSCMEIWGGNDAVETAISVPGLDAWIYSEPHAGSESGGDIHYVSMCGAGAISRFTIADVAGHGQQVSQVATDLRKMMRKHINRVDQSRFARSLNTEFSKLTQDGGSFATALLTTYFAPTDHLILCNAGHPSPLLYRAARCEWRFLRHDNLDEVQEFTNLPLGVIEPTDYHQFAVHLEMHDLVLIYTDSLIEARHKDDPRQMLGEEGLLELVRTVEADTPQHFCRALLEKVDDYRGGQPSEDDATLLLLHHNGADPPRQSLAEIIKVMGKMLGFVKV